MNIVSISDFQKDVLKHIKWATASGQSVAVAIDGQPAAVLVGIEAHETMVAQSAILKILLHGDKDIDSGEGYSMEKVMQEAVTMEKEWATDADRRQKAIERGESRLLPLDAVSEEIRSKLSRDNSEGPESNAPKRSPFDVRGVKTIASQEDVSQAIAESRVSKFRNHD